MKLSKYLTPCSPVKAEWKVCPCYGCLETRATIQQGINLILLECERIHLPVELMQTGGMCMGVGIDLPSGGHIFLTEDCLGVYDSEGEPLDCESSFVGWDAPTPKTRARNLVQYASRVYWQARGYENAIQLLAREEHTEHAEILKQARNNNEHI